MTKNTISVQLCSFETGKYAKNTNDGAVNWKDEKKNRKNGDFRSSNTNDILIDYFIFYQKAWSGKRNGSSTWAPRNVHIEITIYYRRRQNVENKQKYSRNNTRTAHRRFQRHKTLHKCVNYLNINLSPSLSTSWWQQILLAECPQICIAPECWIAEYSFRLYHYTEVIISTSPGIFYTCFYKKLNF